MFFQKENRKPTQRKRRRLEEKSSWSHNNYSFHQCYFPVVFSTATTPVPTQQVERYRGPGGWQSVAYKGAEQSKCPQAPQRKIHYCGLCRNPRTLRMHFQSPLLSHSDSKYLQHLDYTQGTGRYTYCDERTSQTGFCWPQGWVLVKW